ncbi:MAG: DUF3149 domain-containing protein [Acidovorax sp.]|jgi:hypothetical protein|nr:DUF3149 domain-containing protein [Acidovorax sp.]MDR3004244.1 DUF3149 domain-containing protein [Acidovorax sp.]
MKMLVDLFSTDYGLMSLAVIVIILIMAVYFTILFLGKIKSGPTAHDPTAQPTTHK